MRSGLDVAARMKTCCYGKERKGKEFRIHGSYSGQYSSTVIKNVHQTENREE